MNKKPILFSAFIASILMMPIAMVGSAPSALAQGQSSHAGHLKKIPKTEPASYVCPMHPDVKATRPGTCPKCKMDLRKAKPENTPAIESEKPADTRTDSTKPGAARNKMSIPDVAVLDQHGNALHFYTDLIKDKTVAINFIFTNCTTICPPLAATFARLQRELGDKIGNEVHLISISVDPLTDTPERLKAWGAKFKAGPGWTFVTGEKQEMDKLLNALGAAVSKREDHTPAMIIGNDSKGVWTRTYGLAKINQILGVIENVKAGKVDEPATSEEAKP